MIRNQKIVNVGSAMLQLIAALAIMVSVGSVASGSASALCHNSAQITVGSSTMGEHPKSGTCNSNTFYQATLESKYAGCVLGQYNVNGQALTIQTCAFQTTATYGFNDTNKNSVFSYCTDGGCFGPYSNYGF